ncbi:MAG TPA: CDP-alcohol phosphatidyltransferase family protein [Steroidobacteraceae bacterium]|nr:CDP-alcohol phosphatidyltransferase family protein [Steroidobacteraceae bacterium]
MRLRQLPNAISIVRMALVIPIAWFVGAERLNGALALCAIAAFSDALDGYLAKRFGWTSELGKILDPLADKLLLVTLFITLAIVGWIPVWLAVAAVSRDLVIAFGAMAYRNWFGPIEGRPTTVSKINTGLQLIYVLAVIAARAYGLPSDAAAFAVTALGAAVFVTTVVSGIDYVGRYWRKAIVVTRERRQSA